MYYRAFDSSSHARAVRHKKEALDHCFDPFMKVHQFITKRTRATELAHGWMISNYDSVRLSDHFFVG